VPTKIWRRTGHRPAGSVRPGAAARRRMGALRRTNPGCGNDARRTGTRSGLGRAHDADVWIGERASVPDARAAVARSAHALAQPAHVRRQRRKNVAGWLLDGCGTADFFWSRQA